MDLINASRTAQELNSNLYLMKMHQAVVIVKNTKLSESDDHVICTGNTHLTCVMSHDSYPIRLSAAPHGLPS